MKKERRRGLKERRDVEFPMWRKKVDHSLLNKRETPIPKWLWSIWDMHKFNASSKKEKSSDVLIKFQNKLYQGYVTFSKSVNKRRLRFDEELVDSSILKSISNKLDNKDFAIVKSEWKEKEKLSKELDRKNVIYNLIDINNLEFYIGEAQSLKERLIATRKEIPNWTHYRFDVLPDSFGQKERLASERLLIKTFSSVMPKESNSSIRITEKFELKNKKIDR